MNCVNFESDKCNCELFLRDYLDKFLYYSGTGIAVGIATRYGLDGPGIESRLGEIFRTRPDRRWGPPSLLYSEYRVSFPGVKRPGLGVYHSPHRVPRLKKSRTIPLLPLWIFVACFGVNFIFTRIIVFGARN
jgi:hypothetical protein